MKCSVCGKEFGTGNNCQHCGSDKFTGLGNYNGYNAPVGNRKSQIRVKDLDSPSTNYMLQTENVGAMACYACGEIIPSDSKFCPYCSRELFVVCPKCGHNYSSQFPACNQCGTNRNKYYEQLKKEKLELESKISIVREKEGDSAAIKIRTREIETSQRIKASTAEGRAELERERRYIDECRKKWRNQ
jgi:RNA polymerase subunit RPABC4/transcription elongation factor Spt4